MKKLLLPALALLSTLALALLLWKIGGTSERGDGGARDDGGSLEAANVAGTEATLAAAHELASPADRRDADPRARADVASTGEAWKLEDSLWVEGSVRAPAGCSDLEVEVFACAEEVDAGVLARWLDGPRRGAKDRGQDAESAEPPASADAPFVSRRAVLEGGTFRVPFPPGTTRGWLHARGRYQHTEEALEIDLASNPRGGVLDTGCGACVTGTLVLAADVVPDAALDELDVVLSTRVDGVRADTTRMRGARRSMRAAGQRFTFRALPADAKYKLRVEPETLAAAEVSTEALAGGRDHALAIELLHGGTVRGVVRGPEGPIGGADVEATTSGQWFGFDDRVGRKTTAREDGTFELQAVTPGEIKVRAKKADWLEGNGRKVEVADRGVVEGVEIELSRGASVAGTVTWADGAPAGAVEVELSFDMSAMVGMGAFNALHGAKGGAKTDAEGRFRIGGLGAGPFTLKAKALPAGVEFESASLREKAMHRARVDGAAAGATALVLVLREPSGIAGRVVDPEGAAIAKFSLHAVRVGQGPLGGLGQEEKDETFDDEQGRFLLTGMIEGKWKVFAEAEGYGPGAQIEVDLPRGAGEPELVLALAPAATIEGRVLDSTGNPVAGASVETDTGVPSWQRMMSGGPDLPSANSGPDGRFVLGGLPAGKLALVAKAKDHAPSEAVSFDLASGAKVEDAVLTLRLGGSLTGEVFQDGGAPGAGMMVQLSETKRFDQHMGFADGEGRFEFEHVAAGAWQVVALPLGKGGADMSSSDGMIGMVSKMKTAMVDIVDGEKTHVVLGAPPADPVRVHGRVTHAGEPYGGAMVAFLPDGKDTLGGMKMTPVGADGSYSVVLDKPGTYSASVQKISGGMGQQSTIEYSCDIPEEKEHELDFALPNARISGRVLGPGGDPTSGTRMSLYPQAALAVGTIWGGQYTEIVTGADGRYDIEALRPGTYTLVAGGVSLAAMFGGDEAGFGREVRPGIKLGEGEWLQDFDFRLKQSGSCEVTVVDASGAPVAEAAIFARTTAGDLLDRFSFVTTDASGRRKYGGLAPGDYTFSARKDLLACQESARVRVEEGATAAAKVLLQAGTVLLVTVTGADDKPVKATISVQDDQGREVGGMLALADVMKLFSSGEGLNSKERRIGPVPPGKYKVKAADAAGHAVTKMVTLNGQPERKVTIRIE